MIPDSLFEYPNIEGKGFIVRRPLVYIAEDRKYHVRMDVRYKPHRYMTVYSTDEPRYGFDDYVINFMQEMVDGAVRLCQCEDCWKVDLSGKDNERYFAYRDYYGKPHIRRYKPSDAENALDMDDFIERYAVLARDLS